MNKQISTLTAAATQCERCDSQSDDLFFHFVSSFLLSMWCCLSSFASTHSS